MNQMPKSFIRSMPFFLALFGSLFSSSLRATTDLSGQPIYRILCVGGAESIAGTNMLVYQYPLWEKLLSAGYLIEYVGSQTSDSRIGKLKYERSPVQATDTFRKQRADILLLQIRHYPTADQQPFSNSIAPYEALIQSCRAANSNVVILMDTMLPMANLPQYSYVPEFNQELRKLANRLNTTLQSVVIVPGAADNADAWFNALRKILEPPRQAYHPRIVTYKKANGADLTLHIFAPSDQVRRSSPRPAIVFFFGGGWKVGTPIQFYAEATHFAEKGFVAISADYRIESVEHTTPFESVADGKSAIRWVRQHAKELGVDPDRIVGSGASAGGHVAAATATLKGLDEPSEDAAISSRPNALVLWYGVVDNGPGGYGYDRVKDRYREISPLHNIDKNMVPTLFFLGTKDSLIPEKTGVEFKQRIIDAGGRCDLILFEGSTHVIHDYRKGDCELRRETLAAADKFLTSIGFMGR